MQDTTTLQHINTISIHVTVLPITTGTFLGGAYEYLCSVFTELVFGKVFWDYSWMPFNLGGRINLLYCFFWGIAAVVWFKILYPKISGWIEKIPVVICKTVTWMLIVLAPCRTPQHCST